MTFIGDIHVHGFSNPLWISYKPKQHKFQGADYKRAIKDIRDGWWEPGDILLRTFDGYLSSRLIPGSFKHGGIYLGNEQVVHSIAEGVLVESIYDFMRTDHFAVVRPRGLSEEERKEVAEIAYAFKGMPYDFAFKYGNDPALYCTELVGRAYSSKKDKFKFKMSSQGFGPFKRKTLLADDIFLSDVSIIFHTRSTEKMSVGKKKVLNELYGNQ